MTARTAASLVLASALVASACGPAATPVDAGGGGIDSGTPPPDAGLPPATASTLSAAGFALGVAAAMTAPLVPSAESLRDGGGRLDGPARETRAHTDLEAGVSGMSVVTPSTCASYVWSGLSVVATFAGCTLEATGESIDGSIGIAVTFFPSTFTLTFTGLSVGTTQIDGMLTLSVGGACGATDLGCTRCPDVDPACAAAAAPQSSLTGNLTVMSSGTTVLSITTVTVTTDATGINASGTFTLDGTSMTATSLHWNTGDCLPTSGTVSVSSPAATITFLPTTPADGIVSVAVGAFPPFPQMLFMPCAP